VSQGGRRKTEAGSKLLLSHPHFGPYSLHIDCAGAMHVHAACLTLGVGNGLLQTLFDAFKCGADGVVLSFHVLDTINKEAQMLATQPLMGRARPELGRGIRSWPTSTSYVLFYVVKGSEVIIVRALHHARDIRHIAWTKWNKEEMSTP
jgi:plasmid stabilization system protein ParE